MSLCALLLSILPRLLRSLDVLLLGEDVCEGAFATEDVATTTTDRIASDAQTEAARAKGEEGVATEAGGIGGPVGFGEGSFVGCEDGTGGVSFA